VITVVYKTAQITTSHRKTRGEMRVRWGDAELVPGFKKNDTDDNTLQHSGILPCLFIAKNTSGIHGCVTGVILNAKTSPASSCHNNLKQKISGALFSKNLISNYDDANFWKIWWRYYDLKLWQSYDHKYV